MSQCVYGCGPLFCPHIYGGGLAQQQADEQYNYLQNQYGMISQSYPFATGLGRIVYPAQPSVEPEKKKRIKSRVIERLREEITDWHGKGVR